MDENAPRPPYVQFEIRSVEDRTASIETGGYVPKDVVFALVTPAGTKDRLEKPADDWIESLKEGVKQERIPESWLYAAEARLKAFRENREDPEEGTPVSNWSALSPAQCRMLQDMGIRSVEHVAEMTEEACGRFGMGGRALKAKAQAWLDSSSGAGKVAEEVVALRVENEALKARNAELDERMAKLEAMVEAQRPKPEPKGAKENA